MTRRIELSAGIWEYDDRGIGPVVVLLHGAMQNASVWDGVVDRLERHFRCVVPTLPLGGHAEPMDRDADLSPDGVAKLINEFLQRLELLDVTVIGSDTGGALAQLLATRTPERIGRLILVSCDAFDNFPPGLPGKTSALAAQLPGGLLMAAHAMRSSFLAHLPITWGWMTTRMISPELLDSWFTPLRTRREARRDLRAFLRAVDDQVLQDAARRLEGFDRPALIIWAEDDRVMPSDHAARLAVRLPDARVVMIPDSYTLIQLDQPERLASEISTFVATHET